jgi:uncharacterized protein (TIGR00288 family)
MAEDTPNIAVYADYENVALGAKEAGFKKFDIGLALGRLLERGNVVVRKAYCDWSRYKSDRARMHERSFELVEVPHSRQAGKNSADIRMVVDALDLAHTKSHVDVFALITGDSDFSPLVSKLRENGKRVIGIGVRKSTSDLLVENCDEFFYYDDLVRESKPARKRPRSRKRAPSGDGGDEGGDDAEARKLEGIELVLDTVEALFRDRSGIMWGSLVKQTIRRKHPNFAESYYGYRGFNDLLEDAQERELLSIEKDERSGGYRIHELGPKA